MKARPMTIFAGFFLCALALAGRAQEHSVGETIDDAAITATVKAALVDTESVHARNINVDACKGTVALIGYVRSDEQGGTALKVASSVDGVNVVADSILVGPEERSAGTMIDDQTMEAKVNRELTEIGAYGVFSTVTKVHNRLHVKD
jgi:hypothetical protein